MFHKCSANLFSAFAVPATTTDVENALSNQDIRTARGALAAHMTAVAA